MKKERIPLLGAQVSCAEPAARFPAAYHAIPNPESRIMKRETLTEKLSGAITEAGGPITLGEITLAIRILELARASNPEAFEKLRPLIP